MVRETRHLWVGNLPDNIREDRIREHFKRYGRVQSVKLLPRNTKEEATEGAMACTVAFMDIKSASKALNAEHKLDDRTLTTEYYEPAAIPSAASPQNTPSSYSTSPGTTRFPNGHGSSEEHATFGERFYERSNSRGVTDTEFIRGRSATYHENCRGRNRDRSYRNGPYNGVLERAPPPPPPPPSHRPITNSWPSATYDTATATTTTAAAASAALAPRYNSTSSSQNETGYASTTTPTSDSNERRTSDPISTKKPSSQSSSKAPKSRSGSRSPSPPSASTSSRSPSRSRSQSSSSSSSSSTSRATTSSSSEKRPVAICVKNLPPRSSDTSLKDGLFHEYKKHGKVTWVKVVGQGSERYAIVCFKKPEDVDKALEVSYDKLFFGCKIEVEPYQGYDVEDNDLRPYEAEIDEFHPKATRTLFIGNLEKDVTASDLRKHFDLFGEIIEIDIKKQGAVGSYAFCQYSDIVSVVKAIRTMDGEHLGNNRIKLGFGKSMPTNCVWVDGVVDVNDKYLRIHFEPFGSIGKVHVDREKGQALIFYEQVVGAQLAVNKMRGFSVKGSKIQVDFASRECQESFFEHLEKQGAVLDRTACFEERRDSASRTFDAATGRFSRYETPTRPRTASYSSRTSVAGAATSQATPSALPSPGTPGSVTPRGSRSRGQPRFDYYTESGEYGPDRHGRTYDEYSQGSGASHEDPATEHHEYPSPTHHPEQGPVGTTEHAAPPFAQPDIRNLQKERVQILEQLEECPSSGDELISPKKRLKTDVLDLSGVSSEVTIESNRDHRKVMEVRRLSDPNLKHHSRRPSVDSKHVGYLPHPVCKRRKTAGSDSGSRSHHYEHSGPESVGGSRPGTPLVDERPEHFAPSEPRRTPREREGPLSLPLPRFAAQLKGRGAVSVAGIKGQKDALSPPAAVTSPRISCPKPPSPVHVPPPASPPPRPPSLSSNSSDSSGLTPPSPSLDERIRSLDEKYEKWSGSRVMSAAGGDALAKLDATREKFRLRHKLLDLDLKEVPPSDIVKSVMAKRSVFDEDLKRLENVGEKYEPKEFAVFPARIVPLNAVTPVLTIAIPPAPLSAPPVLKVPPVVPIPKTPSASTTPTTLSPRSAGTNVTAAKGLQYPFPSHPPMQLPSALMVLPPASGTPTTPPAAAPTPPPPPPPTAPPPLTPPPPSASTTTRATNHGDNRLKSCASASSDNRTSSKVYVNRSGPLSIKNTSEKNSVANIPPTPPSDAPLEIAIDSKPKPPPTAAADKPCDKVTCRRDSSSSGGSPRTARRNSDAATNRKPDEDEERKMEKARVENERLEKEKLERERIEKEKQERLEKERLERERLEREKELEKERLDKERRNREREERERREKEEKDKKDREELEKQRAEAERLERERRREDERQQKQRDESNHEKHRHRDHNRDSSHDNKNAKDEKRDSQQQQESRSGQDKNRHHIERDERRKESVKENRDNNIHDKQKERHISLDYERTKSYEGPKADVASKRKERNNSLPGNIGLKRRLSSHESLDSLDESKKLKIQDHKHLSERRDSKDSTRSEDKNKSKHKNNSLKVYDKHDEKRKERDERHKSKQKLDKHKMKSKSREKDSRESPSTPKSPSKELSDKDFLAKLDLQSNEEIERQKQRNKEKRRELLEPDDKKRDRHPDSSKFKIRSDDSSTPKSSSNPELKCQSQSKKEHRIRKLTQTNSSDSDSDEPKKHSIFDIVDDTPAYISMYDKVKARSCKNMQKQEEEKRQEKIKAKFSQLKQSRAKREEKKRSTSWDEDSDSDRDKSDLKMKKRSKILLSSDEEDQAGKSMKKREVYSDSDSERPRRIKSEPDETSEDERILNKMMSKCSKSRITSDTSDDEHKKPAIKTEIFSDNDIDQGFADSEEKSYAKAAKSELNRIKKERNNKHPDLVADLNAHIFGPLLDIKPERFDSRHCSSDEENADVKKELKKKHKKKQKRQKHSLSSSEECSKTEVPVDNLLDGPEKKHHDKRKPHGKKEKKRDKSRDEKVRKPKKSKAEIKSEMKRDGKMENIFGSLSEDSDTTMKESEPSSFLDRFGESSVYASDSDREQDKHKQEEQHRKRKEKKRREKERRLQQEEHNNDNSMDYADMAKQLEANIKDDSLEVPPKLENHVTPSTEDSTFSFNDSEFHAEKKDEHRKEREKKKKRKKSKEEKQKHHHHHHHEKTKIKTEIKKEPSVNNHPPPLPPPPPPPPPSIVIDEIKTEVEDSTGLPNLDISGDSPHNKSSSSLDFNISPLARDTALLSPIPKTPTTSKHEKKRDKFIPGFGGSEIDEKIHENAIKSISDKPTEESGPPAPIPPEPEEKPRVVISQEETEDAVAALLGESFGSGGQFEECYNEEEISTSQDPPNLVEDGGAPQDDEEMRQAVQSLSTGGDLDAKPDTPQSEHDLQIDTDTEEPEENARFDPPPKAPEVAVPPLKAPEIPSYYRKEEPKSTAKISGPPSLTPIKTEPKREPPKVPTSLSLPLLPEQPRLVIAQSWSKEKEEVPKPEPSKIVAPPIPTVRTYGTPPVPKLPEPAYPPLTAITKQEHPQIAEEAKLPPLPPKTVLQKPPEPPVAKIAPTSTNLSLNRLPITPVMVSKPLQATTVLLPQTKIAHTLEPPVLVSSSEPRTIQEHPRTVMAPHFGGILPQNQAPPRMVLQGVRPPGLLMPSRQLPPTYPYMSTIPNSFTTVITKDSTMMPVKEERIISSTPSIIVNTSNATNPFMPVIKEAPKLVPLPPEVRISQPSIIQTTTTKVEIEPIKTTVKPEPNFLKVEVIRSTPSPVIVQTPPKEIESIPAIPIKLSPKCKEESQQSAIEKVTEELHLTLKKEVDSVVVKVEDIKQELEDVKPVVVVKELDEEKTETESVISDISKERSSADMLTPKEDPMDTKEDSDYWSAKEVNIDSVIKTLCSADELSDHSSETTKDEWLDDVKDESIKQEDEMKKEDDLSVSFEESDEKEMSARGGRRGGRTRGGRKARAPQTKKPKPAVNAVVPKRGGRGAGRIRTERKSSKSESETADVYEFRDDSDESNKERPRIILTIKPPVTVAALVIKEEAVPVLSKLGEGAPIKEEFLTPAGNTRKSKRLQERDVLRNNVDDTIEDVVRNTIMVTRSAATNLNARRSTRSAAPVPTKASPETARKSPRGRTKKDRSTSADDSSEEKYKTDTEIKSETEEEKKPKEEELSKVVLEAPPPVKEKPHEGLKAAMLRRVKGEMAQEPMTLIDPVTGLLTPMRECEEGRYIPLPKGMEKSVIAASPIQKPKPQSLKAYVLSSQAAKAVVSQQQISKNVIVSQPLPIQQPINVSHSNYNSAHISPRPINTLSKSPNGQMVATVAAVKPQIRQQSKHSNIINRSLIVSPSQIINAQVALLKQQQQIKQAVMNKTKPIMIQQHHQQQHSTGPARSSPPLSKAGVTRLVTPLPHSKGVMEPPKLDVTMPNVILGPRSNLSPHSQQRLGQAGMPAYEASLHGERSVYNRSRSPPPAHQNSPSPQGEAMAHFPPGVLPLRPPHDVPSAHYMHNQHAAYQYLRQTYMNRAPMVPGGMEKIGDGQEGEEAPVTSPPLEMRRPGSVGLVMTGRTPVVPHSLHSPHDRTTDSPQGGQVYNMHTARMQHYHSTGRYYEQIAAEPPPAHRPLTSHGSLTALANERSIPHHMQPERPMSNHSALNVHMVGPMVSAPDRPLSTHMPVDRPHAMALEAGLGAAGNLMGAMARHVGVEAPASLRGLQAATPPYASQVPPQAESLYSLLQQYPCMWQGMLALKNDQAAVQMYFVSGNEAVAKCSLPKNEDGSTPPLRICQRMRLEPMQVEGVARKMQMEKEHCILLALPCGHDHMDVLKQSNNLANGFITYLQQKQAAGIVNVAAPGTTQPPAYVVHIFPSCNFVNENLHRIAPSLLERVSDLAHLLIVITTVS